MVERYRLNNEEVFPGVKIKNHTTEMTGVERLERVVNDELFDNEQIQKSNINLIVQSFKNKFDYDIHIENYPLICYSDGSFEYLERLNWSEFSSEKGDGLYWNELIVPKLNLMVKYTHPIKDKVLLKKLGLIKK